MEVGERVVAEQDLVPFVLAWGTVGIEDVEFAGDGVGDPDGGDVPVEVVLDPGGHATATVIGGGDFDDEVGESISGNFVRLGKAIAGGDVTDGWEIDGVGLACDDEAEFETGIACEMGLGELGEETGEIADDVTVGVVGRFQGGHDTGVEFGPAASLGEIEFGVDELLGSDERGVGRLEHDGSR